MNVLPIPADFTFYGGIYRDVFLITTPDIHFDNLNYASTGIFINTPQVTTEKANVSINGKVINEDNEVKTLKLIVEIKQANGLIVKTVAIDQILNNQTAWNFDKKNH